MKIITVKLEHTVPLENIMHLDKSIRELFKGLTCMVNHKNISEDFMVNTFDINYEGETEIQPGLYTIISSFIQGFASSWGGSLDQIKILK